MTHEVVSHEAWVEARSRLLAEEKDFTRRRDQLSRRRRELPWESVDKEYAFDGPDGKETLADLFAGRSQLIVYHFMFEPDVDEGCPSCSFWADNFDPIIVHLNARGIDLVNTAYNYLDLVPRGRDEEGNFSQYWVRRHDRYER
jgi:predicted dithiol-disulfide oxidoreductase (DUF899 family)